MSQVTDSHCPCSEKLKIIIESKTIKPDQDMTNEKVSVDILASKLESSMETYGPSDMRNATHYYCYGKVLIQEALNQQDFFNQAPQEEVADPINNINPAKPESARDVQGETPRETAPNPFETAYSNALLQNAVKDGDNDNMVDDFQIGWESLQGALDLYMVSADLSFDTPPRPGIPISLIESILQILVDLMTVGYRSYQFDSIIDYGQYGLRLLTTNPIPPSNTSTDLNPFINNHQFSLMGFFYYYVGQGYLMIGQDSDAFTAFNQATKFFLVRLQVLSREYEFDQYSTSGEITWNVYLENEKYNKWKTAVSNTEHQFGAIVNHQDSYIPLAGELPILEFLYNQINPRINMRKNKKKLSKRKVAKASKIDVNSLFFVDRLKLVLAQYLYEIQVINEDKLATELQQARIREKLERRKSEKIKTSLGNSRGTITSDVNAPPAHKKTKRIQISMSKDNGSSSSNTQSKTIVTQSKTIGNI